MKNIMLRGGIEFIAVLLGITLSLWVDEWRQKRDTQERIKLDYINISQEINEDIENINGIISRVQKQIFSLNKLINYHEKKMKFDKSDVIDHIGKVTSPTFYGTQTAYNASVSSGRLNFSEDMNISNEISLLYEHYYQRLNANSELYDFRNQKLKSDYFMPFYKITVGGNNFSKSYEEIFFSTNFGSALYWIKEFVENYYIHRLEETKAQMIKTSKSIQQYLD